MAHPRDILLGAQAAAGFLPVCDHYSGVEVRMRKSLQLQAEMMAEFGACVFDVSLDCEDGAPVGGEHDHAQMVVALANEALAAARKAALPPVPRIAVRVHPVDHAAFEADVATIVGGAGKSLCHLMIPKVESVADVERAVAAVDAAARSAGHAQALPLQVLLESPAAVHRAFEIAAHPRVQSISFGLMDFVSAHGGAIPDSAMSSRPDSVTGELGQFTHPLVLRAKLEIAAACHAHGKVPSHCVVTEFSDTAAMKAAARKAAREFGYTRMWSVHPDQIVPILSGMQPKHDEVDRAARILVAAADAQWGPIEDGGVLHDRASYRLFWTLLRRAAAGGVVVPEPARSRFFGAA